MKAGVLYSGGKDSSLIAVILDRMGIEVELVTVNFGVYESWKPAFESASLLGFEHKILHADLEIINEAIEIILADGFPHHGITHIHRSVLELVAENYVIVADGIRRDDKVPKIHLNEIRSFEDRNNVEYINLQGFGYRSINRLGSHLFKFRREKTSLENNSDYEVEVRYLMDEIHEKGTSNTIFPQHYQSRVIGWK